jgi:hypothetical protein
MSALRKRRGESNESFETAALDSPKVKMQKLGRNASIASRRGKVKVEKKD